MTDRRRINGPPGGTAPPVFSKFLRKDTGEQLNRPARSRQPNALRKTFLRTGVTPSASGSAYLELEASHSSNQSLPSIPSLATSGLKLTCTVHGPRPLPKSAPFSPHIVLSTHVKFAPFATRKRRGYIRDSSERDLGVHLETALRGVIIGDRWPKSGVEVIITILEGEEDQWWGDNADNGSTTSQDWGMMSVLSGCITVASAAIADAGIDCVDVASGGVAAIVRDTSAGSTKAPLSVVLDPVPSEHREIQAACVVAYLPTRDEVTDLWVKGELGSSNHSAEDSVPSFSYEQLADNAVQAAIGTHRVLVAALKETAEVKLKR